MPASLQPKGIVHVVDDEQAVCWALERALTREGYQVAVAASAEEAFTLAARQRPDVVLLDVRLPGLDGLSALTRLRELTQDAPVIIVTAFGNLTTAVRAVEGGVFDYLAKPFDLDQALDTVARALQTVKARGQAASLVPEEPDVPGEAEEFVGRSPAMQIVFKRIALVAPREACVSSSPARAARARSSWPGPSTTTARGATTPSCPSTSRR
jgi:two-component system nitrogen regulation response regulator GlnG